MDKSELVTRVIAKNLHVAERDPQRAVNAMLGRIVDAMVAGDRVELRGFGAFTVTELYARSGQNTKTGVTVPVKARKLVRFRLGRAMRNRLNPSATVTSTELNAEVERPSRGS